MEKGEKPRALQLHGIKIPLIPGEGYQGEALFPTRCFIAEVLLRADADKHPLLQAQ